MSRDQLLIENLARADRKTVELIRSTAERILELEDKRDHYLEVYLVNDDFMQKNVLAFPAPADFPRPDLEGSAPLGEIYLNPKYIATQPLDLPAGRQELGNSELEIPAKLAYMLIHGFLHLCGYDHEKKSDRIVMEKREIELLSDLTHHASVT